MTPAETLLWRHLKANRLQGIGFRRQVPIRNYIADFMSHSTRLIIELDGASHDFAARRSADEARDAWFQSQGYLVLRFTNEEVLGNLNGVAQAIFEAASARRLAPPTLSLPHKGGGNPQTTVRAGTDTSQIAIAVPKDS
jgi:very-short-patch-repair endonuclease